MYSKNVVRFQNVSKSLQPTSHDHSITYNMSEWSKPKYSISDIDEFIIPDEEDDAPDYATINPATSFRPSGGASSTQTTTNGAFSGFSSFMPKVDLASTFAPFATQENSKVQERQFSGGDTLDEPVWTTIHRDVLQIARRLQVVVWPMSLQKLALKQQLMLIDFAAQNGINLPDLVRNRTISVEDQDIDEERVGVQRSLSDYINKDSLDWDLWGPLVFSLGYSVALGLTTSSSQTSLVFSGSFLLIWLFYVVVGLNIQLLGGTISFLSAISAVGYLMFPITLGEILCALLIKWKLVRLILMTILNIWSIYAGVMSLKCSGVLPGRVLLAVYPVGLMYSVLSWLVIIT